MKKCRGGANFGCPCVTNGGYCSLPEGSACTLQEELNFGEESATRKIMKTRKCNSGSDFLCKYKTSEGVCFLPSYEFCIMAYVEPEPPLVGATPTEELKPQAIMGKHNEAGTIKAGVGVKVGPDDINKIKICCDEITLTKDSIGIEVNIQNLIQSIDKFETIEINGRVFKRVREE